MAGILDFPMVHPGRSPSADEMQGRGLADIMDPGAVLPQKCSDCGRPSSFENPLMMEPVDRNPKMLARCYLYRARCARCKEQAARRR